MISATRQRVKQALADVKFALWDEWSPRSYLNTYFSQLGPDSFENLKFLIKELRAIENAPVDRILDFGAGPTIFTAIVAAPYAKEIHIADYLKINLETIEIWLKKNANSFNWDPCIKEILKLEGQSSELNAMKTRAERVREITTRLLRCDASMEWPLTDQHLKYPVVIANFCADSATSSKETWRSYMKNLFNVVEDSGKIIVAALRNCRFYRVGNQFFPSANINENDMKILLSEEGFTDINIEVVQVPDCAHEGFTSLVFTSAKKIGTSGKILEKAIQTQKSKVKLIKR